MDVEPLPNYPADTRDWQEWLAESLLLGVATDEIVAAMERKGVRPADARRWIVAQQNTPSFRVADRLLGEHPNCERWWTH